MYIYKNKSTLLQTIDHNYNTRYKLKENIEIAIKNKTIGQKSLKFLSTIIYNFLPTAYKNYLLEINSIGLFKSYMKSFILHVERSTVHSLIERDILNVYI